MGECSKAELPRYPHAGTGDHTEGVPHKGARGGGQSDRQHVSQEALLRVDPRRTELLPVRGQLADGTDPSGQSLQSRAAQRVHCQGDGQVDLHAEHTQKVVPAGVCLGAGLPGVGVRYQQCYIQQAGYRDPH